MMVEWYWLLVAALAGWWSGRLFFARRWAKRFDKLSKGYPMEWEGQVWSWYAVPQQPPFPRFTRQKGRLHGEEE